MLLSTVSVAFCSKHTYLVRKGRLLISHESLLPDLSRKVHRLAPYESSLPHFLQPHLRTQSMPVTRRLGLVSLKRTQPLEMTEIHDHHNSTENVSHGILELLQAAFEQAASKRPVKIPRAPFPLSLAFSHYTLPYDDI